MKASNLSTGEYHPYYGQYLALLGDAELLPSLKQGLDDMEGFLLSLEPGQLSHAYAPDKWTIAEAIVHLVDTERIFQYRALRFARNDQTHLMGFDQDAFAMESDAGKRSKEQLLAEFKAVRHASIALFESLDTKKLLRIGTASGSQMSVRALGFMISAHQAHHDNLFKTLYLG